MTDVEHKATKPQGQRPRGLLSERTIDLVITAECVSEPIAELDIGVIDRAFVIVIGGSVSVECG